jgi:hypothetical protein
VPDAARCDDSEQENCTSGGPWRYFRIPRCAGIQSGVGSG